MRRHLFPVGNRFNQSCHSFPMSCRFQGSILSCRHLYQIHKIMNKTHNPYDPILFVTNTQYYTSLEYFQEHKANKNRTWLDNNPLIFFLDLRCSFFLAQSTSLRSWYLWLRGILNCPHLVGRWTLHTWRMLQGSTLACRLDHRKGMLALYRYSKFPNLYISNTTPNHQLINCLYQIYFHLHLLPL